MAVVPDMVQLQCERSELPVNRLLDLNCTTKWGSPIYGLENLKFYYPFGGRSGIVIRGSLPKFILGENASPCSLTEIKQSLCKIEELTGIPMEQCRVVKLEVGTTLAVSKGPAEYLSTWGSLSRCHRDSYGNGSTIYFRNGTWEFYGYDKGREMGRKPLPECFAGQYALRVELRIKNSVTGKIGKEINPWQLIDPDIVARYRSLWGSTYRRIVRVNNSATVEIGRSPKEMKRYLERAGLVSLGIPNVEAKIQTDLHQGIISSQHANRMRKELQSLSQDQFKYVAFDYVSDLDGKVSEALELE